MKSNNAFILFFVILSTISCNQKNKQIESNDFTIMEVNIKKEIHNDYSFVKSARFVFLDSILPVGKIEKLIITDKQIIVLDRMTETINLYDTNGKLINTISSKGRGMGEYNFATDIAFSKEENCILVLDSKKKKILKYSIDTGAFLSDLNIDIYPTKIASDSSCYYLYNPFIFNYPDNKDNMHSIFILNKGGGIKHTLFSNDNDHGKILLSNKGLYDNSLGVFFNNKLENSIFSFRNGHITSEYKIKFEENEGYESYLNENINKEIIEKFTNSKYAYEIQDVCISENFLYFKYIQNKHLFNVVLQKSNDSIIFHDFNEKIWSSELVKNNIPIFKFPTYCFKNEFVSIIEPDNIKLIYNRNNKISINKDADKVVDKFYKITIMNNPIIAFYKFETNEKQ